MAFQVFVQSKCKWEKCNGSNFGVEILRSQSALGGIWMTPLWWVGPTWRVSCFLGFRAHFVLIWPFWNNRLDVEWLEGLFLFLSGRGGGFCSEVAFIPFERKQRESHSNILFEPSRTTEAVLTRVGGIVYWILSSGKAIARSPISKSEKRSPLGEKMGPKLAIFPLKRSVLGAWKGHFRARKGQMVDSVFQDPKTTWNVFKTREKTSQHHNWPRYMDCPQIGPKGQMVPIARPRGGVP